METPEEAMFWARLEEKTGYQRKDMHYMWDWLKDGNQCRPRDEVQIDDSALTRDGTYCPGGTCRLNKTGLAMAMLIDEFVEGQC